MSGYRASIAPPPNSNLYCAECDSQIGIFENEWRHLTSSYAKSQEKGTHFGTEIGVRTQIVPAGSAQKIAEGCEMSEVFCTQCSTVVAQYCRNAPDASKQHLVGQHFYKLSRVYLKDSQTSAKIDPVFTDGERGTSQELPGSVRTSAVPQQRLPSTSAPSSTPFRQSFPPPSNYGPQHSQYRSFPAQLSPPDYLRPASTLGVPGFYQDQNHSAQLAECSSRVAATDMRVAGQELRISSNQERLHSMDTSINNYIGRLGMQEANQASLDAKYTNMEANCTALDVRFSGHATIIENQQKKIDEHDRQLRYVTAKLEEFQGTIDDLKATIEVHRRQSQSLLQRSPRPDSRDFLEDLEVMVKAMKSIRSNDDEIQALRDENRAMKGRLKTIATVMGAASEGDLSLLSDETGAEEMEETLILGKRKRATDHDDDQARKVSRPSGSILQKLEQNAPLLPTPGCSQHDADSFLDSTERESQVDDDDNMVGHENGSKETELRYRTEGGLGASADDDVVEEVERRPSTSNAEENDAEGMDKPAMSNGNSVHLQNLSARDHYQPVQSSVEARQTSIVPTQVQRPATGQDLHDNGYPRFDPNRSTISVPGSVHTQQGTPAMTCPAYFPQNPVSMHTRMMSASVRNSPAPAPYFRSLLLSPSQSNSPSYANVQPPQRFAALTSSTDNETFSGALSRGERLDNFIHRTQSPSVMTMNSMRQQTMAPTQYGEQNTPYTSVNILQPRQGSALNSGNIPRPLTATAGEMQPKTDIRPVNPSANAESIDFSDEENTTPASHSTQNASRNSQLASTTPAGEPSRRATLISRTVRGFTLEPLERPVIEDNRGDSLPQAHRSNRVHEETLNKELKEFGLSHWIGNDKNNEKYREDVRRARAEKRKQIVTELQNRNVRAPSIMPEFMAAINNLNGSAARQATPASAIAPPKPVTETSKKSRKSEPIPRSSAAAPSSASKLSASITTTLTPNIMVNINNTSKPTTDNPLPRSTSLRSRNHLNGVAAQLAAKAVTEQTEAHDNDDDCGVCEKAGTLIMCNGCPKSYHRRCLKSPPKKNEPKDVRWFCPRCEERNRIQQQEQQKQDKTRKSLLRKQVLIERNRLAMETMEREVVADRQQR